MITVSQLAILTGAVALVCIVSMMLHLRSEAARKRVERIEQKLEELSAAQRKGC